MSSGGGDGGPNFVAGILLWVAVMLIAAIVLLILAFT
jgi:hypothetical protein